MTAAARTGRTHHLGALAVGLATAIALTGFAIVLFFNPLWVEAEQARARADLYTGFTPDQVRAVTAAIVREVYLGPGTFLQAVDGVPVLGPRERAHMADVRTVYLAFLALVALAMAVLVVGRSRSRDGASFWRSVARGAAVLALGAAVAGVAFLLFFDAAFELFHRLFFAGGTYTFDPATERLVQLFPDQFWTETTVAIAAVGMVLTGGTWFLARRRADRFERAGGFRAATAAGGPGGAAGAPQAPGR